MVSFLQSVGRDSVNKGSDEDYEEDIVSDSSEASVKISLKVAFHRGLRN